VKENVMNEKPICYELGREIPEIFHGVPSFMGLPVIQKKHEIRDYDVVIMGAPWEGVVTWGSFSGCELATKSIRNVSVRYAGFLPEMGFDIFDYLKAGDYGDAPTNPGHVEKTLANIQDKATDIYHQGAIPITFGGDHSITIPLVRALAEKTDGDVGIIHLDAHMDNMDKFGDELYARCSPLYRIYEIENVNPVNVIHMGIRGPRNNPKQVAFAKEKGATILTSFEIKLNGIEYAVNRALEVAKAGTDAVYVTVCSDVLDAAFNPGGPIDFNGLTPFELSLILHKLACAGIDGFDIAEIYPPSDPASVSSHAAVWMSLYVMSGIVKDRFNLE
jgi:agmatinase